MANAKPVAICPYCRNELSYPIPQSCPKCLTRLAKADNEHFSTPDYLYYQKKDLIENLDKKVFPSDSEKYWTRVKLLDDDLAKWARECLNDEKIAAMHDAVLILENVMHSDIDAATLKTIVQHGKAAGALADSIERYLKAGGSLYDRTIKQILSNTGDASFGDQTDEG
jgi:hypothetical protein